MMPTSCATKECVDVARNKACDLLLTKRVESKINQGKTDTIANRIFMTSVKAREDRTPTIPASVLAKREAMNNGMEVEEEKRETERDIQEANGGAGVHVEDLRKHFQLKKVEWKYDVVPEIMDGHNVADFVDEDIEARLMELEKEEDMLFNAAIPTQEEVEEDNRLKDATALLNKVKAKKNFNRLENVLRRRNNNSVRETRLGRKECSDLVEGLAERGTALEVIEEVVKRRSKSATRGRSLTRKRKRDEDEAEERGESLRPKSRSLSKARSKSELSMPKESMQKAAESLRKKKMRRLNQDARRGEGDRHIPDWKPKHLYSGKTGRGKRDWR